MKSWLRHPLRVTYRLLWLTGVLLVGFLDFLVWRPSCSADTVRDQGARWLQRISRRGLRVFHTRIQVSGSVPSNGVLVCNHLSYLDILTISASAPAVFVAKREVARWPVFGWFARKGGTVFVDRERRSRVHHAATELESAIHAGSLVVLFPEGTSSDGNSVLPFHSSLLEPVARNSCAVTTARISYELEDGSVADEVCYWRDMTLVPHLVNLLSKRRVRGHLRFGPSHQRAGDRKTLARELHDEVVGLRPERFHTDHE